ncbi:dna ligase 4-like protein [Nannochloropsis gaditana CCMP526]|uniref:dna ligase 4-like protein n=1 Tax=Nannochloropsis gaditana (strain CCMP526) TaxID=1093141 RepID=UPI00029F6956|nr:dna ligase 4-like protein [Nannochloropsis gaditana CCMP526]EKU22100.1 dna ligase 4-like protein [Nannochloropsis gaditana CCMP526]|eukprot:XP_005854259.1 dna ligase 4-like protein [Nannochloropsis gaditana CCMP526]
MAGMWALDTMALPSVKDNMEDASRSSENLTGVDQHAAESYPTAPKAIDPVDTRQNFTEEALVKLEAAANSLPFAHFCDKCEKAAQAKSAQKKRSIFFDKELIYRLQRASPGPVSIFPILRFLLPETDPRQGQFKLRHRTMGDVIVKTLGLATKSKAALRIMNFSMPEHNGPRMGPNGRILNTLGDFGSTIEDVLVSRIRQVHFPPPSL